VREFDRPTPSLRCTLRRLHANNNLDSNLFYPFATTVKFTGFDSTGGFGTR